MSLWGGDVDEIRVGPLLCFMEVLPDRVQKLGDNCVNAIFVAAHHLMPHRGGNTEDLFLGVAGDCAHPAVLFDGPAGCVGEKGKVFAGVLRGGELCRVVREVYEAKKNRAGIVVFSVGDLR